MAGHPTYRLVPREALTRFVSLQGVKTRRPSRIHISIDTQGEGGCASG